MRDGSGNLLSLYEKGNVSVNNGALIQREAYLYGAERLDVSLLDLRVDTTISRQIVSLPGIGSGFNLDFVRGKKLFELTNHLGIIMSVKNFIYILIFFLFSCSEDRFSDSDFAGCWLASDGAEVIFNKDGTCVLTGLNNSIVSIAEDSSEKLSTNGTWKIIYNVNSGITGGIRTGSKITYNLINRKGKGRD